MNQKYRKEDIIGLGAELIRQRGYHATGINDILKEAGIPKGSFYNFFASKEAFAEEIIRWYGGRILRAMRAILRDERREPLDRVRAFYRLLIDGHANEGFVAGDLINNLHAEVAGSSDLLAQAADEQFRSWVEELALCLREAQARGDLEEEQDPVLLAEYLHTSFFGALSRMKATRDDRPLRVVYQQMFALLGA